MGSNIPPIESSLCCAPYPSVVENANIKLYLEVTMRCNLCCAACYQKKERYRVRPEMDYDKIVSIIDHVRPKIIFITGGEPFMRKDIFRIFGAIENRRIPFYVFTNGVLLRDDDLPKIEAYKYLVGFHFSIDAIRETHNRMRHNDCYDHTANLIKSINGFNNADIAAVVNEQNYRELYQFIGLARFFRTHFNINVEEVMNDSELGKITHLLGISPSMVLLNKRRYSRDFMKFVNDTFFRKYTFFLRRNVHFPSYFITRNGSFFDSSPARGVVCTALTDPQIRVNNYGELVFCRLLRKTFGKLYSSDLRGMLSSAAYVSFRKKVINGGRHLSICKRCPKAQFLRK